MIVTNYQRCPPKYQRLVMISGDYHIMSNIVSETALISSNVSPTNVCDAQMYALLKCYPTTNQRLVLICGDFHVEYQVRFACYS